jgi:hypothetical protein
LTPPQKSPKPQAMLAARARTTAIRIQARAASRRPRRASLSGAGRAGVVVGRDGMDELGAYTRVEPARVLLDQPHPEVDVAEQPALGGRREARRRAELDCAPCIVDERRGEQEVGAEPRMELRDLAADRRHADGVLQQPARVRVVRVGGRRIRPQLRRAQHPLHAGAKRGVRDLGGEELEEALELVCVAPHRGRERGRIGLRRRFDRADRDLEAVAEALDPPEHPHRVALGEAAVEELHVLPHARVDAAARIDELEREVRRAAPRPQPLLARDTEHALDHPVLGELDDGGHGAILGPKSVGAGVQPHFSSNRRSFAANHV